jgi:hypothetical protein
MTSDDDIDDVWDKLNHPTSGGPSGDGDRADPDDMADSDEELEIEVAELGPPVRVTLLIKAATVPIAPWAQGWRIGAIGPDVDGHVTLICEHDIDLSPVAQLSAVAGLLGSVKTAQLDLLWWAIQARAPFPGEGTPEKDIDDEFSELLGDWSTRGEDGEQEA